ncbi:MAG TPA: TetR/AcrR family transcriptional regulator [Clostridia bacterium]|nr:TetR/AcrR family transcriptional regulator [Clostridia bacterium]
MARISKQPEERRGELLETADRLFAEKGFAAVRVSDIVSAMRVAQGTFYYYFPSKDEAFLALLEEKWRQIAQYLRGKLARQVDAVERLSAALSFLVRPDAAVLENPSCRLLTDPAAMGTFHPQFDGARVKCLFPVMREVIAYGVERGAFAPFQNEEKVVKIVFLGISACFHETSPEAVKGILPAVCETVERVLRLPGGTVKLQF